MRGRVARGRRVGVPVVHDLGRGPLARPEAGSAWAGAVATEPCASESVATGADGGTFSGDKLLGGPQAGGIGGGVGCRSDGGLSLANQQAAPDFSATRSRSAPLRAFDERTALE